MRVLVVADRISNCRGGLEKHAASLIRNLNRLGHEAFGLSMLPVDVRLELEQDNRERVFSSRGLIASTYEKLGRKADSLVAPFVDPLSVRAIHNAIRIFKPDLVHAHGWCSYSTAFACRGAVPVIVTLHDYGLICPRRDMFFRGMEICSGPSYGKCLMCVSARYGTVRGALINMGVSCGRVLMSSVTIMIAVSEYVRERHLGQMDIAVGRVIPNFYDSGELPSAAPTQYELSPNVVFVGHPSFEKGFDVFVKLAALMQSSAVRFTAILPTPPFKDVLESHPTNLCLMIGIPRYQVLKTLQSASLVLVPSRIPDSCPTVVLEAMALGRVVVGSSVGGIPTLIRNGVTGYLVNPEDLEYQLQLVRDILADENRRITVGSCAKIEFSQKFDARIVVSKIAKVYQEVVSH